MEEKKDCIANLKAATIIITADMDGELRDVTVRALNTMIRIYTQGIYELPTGHKGMDFHKVMVTTVKMVALTMHNEIAYTLTEDDIEELILFMMDTYFNPLVMNPVRRWVTNPQGEYAMAFNYTELYINEKVYRLENNEE
jgi:hypothetical protein